MGLFTGEALSVAVLLCNYVRIMFLLLHLIIMIIAVRWHYIGK